MAISRIAIDTQHRNSLFLVAFVFGILLPGCMTAYHPSSPPETHATSAGPETPLGKEETYILQASNILLPKSWKNMNFKILQSMGNGALCIRREYNYDLASWYYTGETFFWIDSDNATVADEDTFHGDMYWCGTYSYVTVKNVEKTVHAYTTKYDLAVAMVRNQFGLYEPPDQGADASAPPTPETPVGSTQPVQVGSGTGFFITADGYLLTCYHVVKDGEGFLILRDDDSVSVANLVAFDEATDLAVLKADCVSRPVNFGRMVEIKLGQAVLTIGFPSPQIQGYTPKVTKGVISSLTGLKGDVMSLQIDAAVQPGNSGGPLMLEDGRVIGVVNARANEFLYSSTTGSSPENVNFALKREFVMAFLQGQAQVAPKLQTFGGRSMTAEEAISATMPSVVLVAAFVSK